MLLLRIYLIFYGVIALSHIIIQMVLAHREHKKQIDQHFDERYQSHCPSVTVIVPCFNEDPELLRDCLYSIHQQKYQGSIEAIVVDDCSKNKKDLLPIFKEAQEQYSFQIIFQPCNKGKREAQKVAFDLAKGEIIVTVDSDTIITRNGIAHIVRQFKNLDIAAVTGDVRVENNNKNLLTRLISYRYWTAFHQERAAQSLYDVLMCCSGPFSAYRTENIKRVKEQYVQQYFLGKKCTYGDDRHLTNLILEYGYAVRFDHKAVAYTHVPTTVRQYIKQQIRWNKSFYREMLWTIKFLHRHHYYMLYDLAMQFILPFMLLIALIAMVYQTIIFGIEHLIWYFVILIGIAIIRSSYGMYRTKDIGFLTFILYGFMHVFLLIPIRIYALCTLDDMKWGTR